MPQPEIAYLSSACGRRAGETLEHLAGRGVAFRGVEGVMLQRIQDSAD